MNPVRSNRVMFRLTIREVLWLTVDQGLVACIMATWLVLLTASIAR